MVGGTMVYPPWVTKFIALPTISPTPAVRAIRNLPGHPVCTIVHGVHVHLTFEAIMLKYIVMLDSSLSVDLSRYLIGVQVLTLHFGGT